MRQEENGEIERDKTDGEDKEKSENQWLYIYRVK